jgi:hypothetical protein
MLAGVQRVLQARGDNIADQHVVSKVLLKRFAARLGKHRGLIVPFNLDHPQGNLVPRGPDGCGKIKNFVPVASASLEQVWKPTEDALHRALQSLDESRLFEEPAHVATIRDAIALHYIRSTSVQEMYNSAVANFTSANRAWWLNEGRAILDRAYYQMHKLHPGGDQGRAAFVDGLMEPYSTAAENGALFRASVEVLFAQARMLLSRFGGVEILQPEEGEFLIGDVPALTVRHDQLTVGVKSGIALGDASSVILPLGSHHLAALGPTDQIGTVSKRTVDRLNTMQVQGVHKYVYFRPESQLEETVHAALAMRVLQAIVT